MARGKKSDRSLSPLMRWPGRWIVWEPENGSLKRGYRSDGPLTSNEEDSTDAKGEPGSCSYAAFLDDTRGDSHSFLFVGLHGNEASYEDDEEYQKHDDTCV